MAALHLDSIAGIGFFSSQPFTFIYWIPVKIGIGHYMALRFKYPGGFVSYIRNNRRRAPWIRLDTLQIFDHLTIYGIVRPTLRPLTYARYIRIDWYIEDLNDPEGSLPGSCYGWGIPWIYYSRNISTTITR